MPSKTLFYVGMCSLCNIIFTQTFADIFQFEIFRNLKRQIQTSNALFTKPDLNLRGNFSTAKTSVDVPVPNILIHFLFAETG